MPRAPIHAFRVEPIDRWSVRFFDDRQVFRVYHVRTEGDPPRVVKVPLGAATAGARVFVPPSGRGRLMYAFHQAASRALDVSTLAYQLSAAGWMDMMLRPPGATSPR